MDGNRGAKGSIRDRLISMLYRLRYAKKVKKEEDYELAKKEKQVKYLKKLKELEENNNIDILDSTDKNQLEKIKIPLNYKLSENKFTTSSGLDVKEMFTETKEIDASISEGNYNNDMFQSNIVHIHTVQKTSKIPPKVEKINTNNISASKNTVVSYKRRKKVGIAPIEIPVESIQIDSNLKEIESKTNELDEKVELKKEIKKTKNEIVILEEVDKFINKSKELLNEISDEVDSLKKLSREKNQDPQQLEERYKKLREKVDKLKAQYDAVKEKYDLSEFSILESIKLIDNIRDYKSIAALNEMDMMIKVCKKEITKIENVTVEYEETKKVGENIENIKNDHKDIKIKFNKSKDNVIIIINQEEELNDKLKIQEQVIEEMYNEASYFDKVVRKEIQYIRKDGIFSSLLNIAGGILTLPFTGLNIFGIALGSTMINRGLKKLNQSFETKEKIVHEFKYTDITHKISEVKDKVEYANLIISDNLNEIHKLKQNFKKYSEYNKVLPEYEEILEKIDKLEEKLLLHQQKVSKMDNKLEEEKELNNEKIKKVMKYRDKY